MSPPSDFPPPPSQFAVAPAGGNDAALRALAALVVKDGVGLGGLRAAEQALALALVWTGLPEAAVDERGINEALKAQLAGPAACLDTDHVELRRWLVDAGWLTRDSWGRSYQRRSVDELTEVQRPLAAALAGHELASWVAATRAAHHARRMARRDAWAAGRGAGT